MRKIALLVALFTGFVLVACDNESEKMEAEHVDNPVMLYKTVGIEECEYDNRYGGKSSGAVRLEGDDLAKAIAFLGKRYDGVTAVLYINAPEADEDRRGQPALLPLIQENGKYCALGVAGSYSVPLFLELEEKYQEQVQ